MSTMFYPTFENKLERERIDSLFEMYKDNTLAGLGKPEENAVDVYRAALKSAMGNTNM